jgi:uncharacterized membrane protein YfcA
VNVATWALVVPVGLVIGLSLGALGGGGSILTVPALVYLLGQDAHGATTASLVIVGVTAVAGMTAHARAHRVRFGDGLMFGALGVAGSVLGSRLSAGMGSFVLLSAFAGLMLVAAAAMAHRAGRGRANYAPVSAGPAVAGGKSVPGAGPVLPLPAGPRAAIGPAGRPTAGRARALRVVGRARALRVVGAASVVGLLTGFFGVGGGFVVVPALVLVLGFEMPEAVGTSLLVIAINTAAALAARVGAHVQVDWPLVAAFIAAAVMGSVAGNRVAAVARPALLARAFTALLVVVALYTAARSLPHVI